MTGVLWDTENGAPFVDEINLVDTGFNSGWKIARNGATRLQSDRPCDVQLRVTTAIQSLLGQSQLTLPPLNSLQVHVERV